MGANLLRSGRCLALFLLVGGTVAACGDDDDTVTSETTAAAAASATTTAAGGAATTAADGATTIARDDGATTAGEDGATTTGARGTAMSLDELYAAAQEEGKLVVYASLSPDPLAQVAADFEAKYPGIDVEAIRGIDGDLAPKVETEHDTGQVFASLYVSASLSWVESHGDMGWFLPVDGPELSGEGTYDAEQYVHEGNFFEIGSAVLSFGWNSDLFPPGITDYPDLLDPELAGKMGVPEPSSPSIVDFYLWLEETFGEDYLTDLAALDPQIYPSGVAIGDALAAGEVAASPYIVPSTLEPLKGQGAPVDFGISAEGAWGARYFAMIMDNSPAPNAARLFANYLITAEGQATLFVNAGTVLTDVPGTLLSNTDVREQDLSKLTPEAVAAYQEKWRGLFQ